MSKKLEMLHRYLMSREDRLEAGEILTVKLEDGMLTVYKEMDPETEEKKTVTLVETFDDQLDMSVNDLIHHPL
jgi:hypothetical protein